MLYKLTIGLDIFIVFSSLLENAFIFLPVQSNNGEKSERAGKPGQGHGMYARKYLQSSRLTKGNLVTRTLYFFFLFFLAL